MAVRTELEKIYDIFYKRFADKVGWKLSPSSKSRVIDEIFGDLTWEQQEVLKAMCRFHNYDRVVKNTGLDRAYVYKQYDIAVRHMYYPKHIGNAVPDYLLNVDNIGCGGTRTPITEADFSGKKYIVNALKKKSGIIYREQLLNLLDDSLFYLYCLPGCGDVARLSILMAIDKWNGKEIKPFEMPDTSFKL